MNQVHQNKINANLVILVRDLDSDRVADALVAALIFNDYDTDTIQADLFRLLEIIIFAQ